MHRFVPSGNALVAALLLALLLSIAVAAPWPDATAQPAAALAATSPARPLVPDQVVLPIERAGLKGMVAHWWYVERYGAALLDHFERLGVTSVRLTVDWLQIEPAEGVRSFARVDPFMDAFFRRGIEVVPVVATIPSWAATNGHRPECTDENSMPCVLDPEKLPAFEATMRRLVARYPQVRRWEFWNEPEMWVSMRNPDVFERWYRAFYRAAKAANPDAVVAVGTLTGYDFIQHLSPDLPMDAASVHPYAGDEWGLDTTKILELRAGLRSRGLDVPIWITEYGWSSWMDSETRARMLKWVFSWSLSQPDIQLAHYHMLHDTEELRECCFGLVSGPPDFSPKQPAYDAFRSVIVDGWTPRPLSGPRIIRSCCQYGGYPFASSLGLQREDSHTCSMPPSSWCIGAPRL